jgi:hypothetical protein
MSHRATHSKRAACLWLAAILLASVALSSASAQQFEVKTIIERKVALLPPGQLFWRIDTYPTLVQAQAAASSTALAAEAAGRFRLFTLGPKSGSSPGGAKVAERSRMSGRFASRACIRSNTASFSRQDTVRNLPPVQRERIAQSSHASLLT